VRALHIFAGRLSVYVSVRLSVCRSVRGVLMLLSSTDVVCHCHAAPPANDRCDVTGACTLPHTDTTHWR